MSRGCGGGSSKPKQALNSFVTKINSEDFRRRKKVFGCVSPQQKLKADLQPVSEIWPHSSLSYSTSHMYFEK